VIHTIPTALELKPSEINAKEGEVTINAITVGKNRGKHEVTAGGPIECLTYRDPFSYVYKK